MAEFIPVSGDKQEVPFPTWDQMKEFIGGGYLERIRLSDGRAMYMDEEGKFKGFKPNQMATFLGDLAGIAGDDFIVGNVVVITPEEEQKQDDDAGDD